MAIPAELWLAKTINMLNRVEDAWLVPREERNFASDNLVGLRSQAGIEAAKLLAPFCRAYGEEGEEPGEALTRYVISPEPNVVWKDGAEPPELTPVWEAYGQWSAEKIGDRFGVYLGGGVVLTFALGEVRS